MNPMKLAALAAIGTILTGTAAADVIDFESVANGTPIAGLTIGAATFTSSSLPDNWGNPYVADDSVVYAYVDNSYLIGSCAEGNWLNIAFDGPVTGVGFGFSGPTALPEDMVAAVTLYDAGGGVIANTSFVSDTITNNMNGGPAFVQEGWADLSSYGAISAMRVEFTFALSFSQTYKFDNLTYTPVPAPASAFGLAGLAAVGARRRRSL